MTADVLHYASGVETIPARATAREAAEAMKAKAVGSLVVVEASGEAVGIVTDRDLLERVIADARDAGTTLAKDVMSRPLHVAQPEDPLERVAELMAAHGVRRVPIVRDGRLEGIVSLDDVLAELGEELFDLSEGRRRAIIAAERGARARELARDLGERVRETGEQLEQIGEGAKGSIARGIEGLRTRLRRDDKGSGQE